MKEEGRTKKEEAKSSSLFSFQFSLLSF